MVREATCCCGEATIKVEGDPELQGLCHCKDCRKRTGSAFGWSAYWRDERVITRDGEMQVYRLAPEWGQERYFCSGCGSTLYWRSASFPGMIGVAGGNFTDPPLPDPGQTFQSVECLPWLALPGHWQRHG